MSGPDVFLSYARIDRAVARVFAERFVEEGFTVWWDGALHSGETFDEVIERQLRDAKAVVVLWSPSSVASRWVRAEATQADRRNKLVPAMIEPCDRPIVFELTHAAELSGWNGDVSDPRWRTFMDEVRRMVDMDRPDHGHAAAKTAAGKPQVSQERPAAEPANGAQATRRQPLRPGNDEVIIAAAKGSDKAVAPPPDRPAPDGESHAEIHCLEMEDDELGDDVFVIDSSGLRIGRGAPADIIISHKSISRQHCVIGIANDELIVTDLNSTNGTYIDDERITRATILPVGSVVRLGHVALRHAIRSQPGSEAGGPANAAHAAAMPAGRLAATS